MGKKFLAGVTLGSLAGLAAWTSLKPQQQRELKEKVSATAYEALDFITDYSLNALDIADAMIHDYGVSEKVANLKEKAHEKKTQLTDHFVSDDFDEQTANLRAALKKAKDDENDDIIIDQTTAE
ncbi:hypothetical protein [Limosilactobacillus caecicola]|uniref:hypothetical protein n=1 Tax=Limosilactobacillus caecicola TaxID=2941332 RepID=UPI0020401D0F|nr:hypothetical protein [Limosilactobacillus caecicola]